LLELALGDERIGQLLQRAQMVKRVVVPNKLVNIVRGLKPHPHDDCGS
jgi:hypothetical protein